jgi:hypothetical protein
MITGRGEATRPGFFSRTLHGNIGRIRHDGSTRPVAASVDRSAYAAGIESAPSGAHGGAGIFFRESWNI